MVQRNDYYSNSTNITTATKSNELTNLIPSRTGVFEEDMHHSSQRHQYQNGDHDQNRKPGSRNVFVSALVIVVTATIVVSVLVHFPNRHRYESNDYHLNFARTSKKKTRKCVFCELQDKPVLHEDRSYKITIDNGGGVVASADATVTPMTITYNYELRDGELLFTDTESELVPNVEFDYAVLAMTGIRNVNADTGEDVSLDEVYFHHLTVHPFNMFGAEVLSRNGTNPYMEFPIGYGLHVVYDEAPNLRVNAHLLSNKNLRPIDGSVAVARKQCNECYYGLGKGSDCTPELSGTFKCCGDSAACTSGGEFCSCPTTRKTTTATAQLRPTTIASVATKRYRVLVDVLISRDVDKFQRVDQWNFAAPACHVNLVGDAVFTEYPPDNYCNGTMFGTAGSLFHQIERQQDGKNPYILTKISNVAPSSGTMVWAQSHLHTGGVNATLKLNGEVICSTDTRYGTNPDPTTNARNEKNHLIEIHSCYDSILSGGGGGGTNKNIAGIRFEEGDVFTTESIYNGSPNDPRFSERGAAGEHKNAMSMFFLGVVFDGTTPYFDEMDRSKELSVISTRRTSFNRFGDFTYTFGLK